MSFKERLGRAIMRADSQDLAVIEELCKQRTELLEALKILHRNFRSQHDHLLFLGAPDFVEMDKIASVAITKAEAAE